MREKKKRYTNSGGNRENRSMSILAVCFAGYTAAFAHFGVDLNSGAGVLNQICIQLNRALLEHGRHARAAEGEVSLLAAFFDCTLCVRLMDPTHARRADFEHQNFAE